MKRDYTKVPLRIFIAVGHGGKDPGAVNQQLGLKESACNLAIAMLLQADLKRHGVEVQLSRCTEENDPLREEIAECNAFHPDFAVEIHTNAGGGTGFEVYYQLEPWTNDRQSMQMAQLFDRNVSKYLQVTTRGIKTNRTLGWLRQVTAPCILVENFFVDGPRAKWYSAPEQLARLSKAYAKSILEFFDVPYLDETAQALRFSVVSNNLQDSRSCSCPAILHQGQHYVQLRRFCNQLGQAVYYDAPTQTTVIYPPDQFSAQQIQSQLTTES